MNGYRCLKVVGGDGCVNVNVLSDEWGGSGWREKKK